MASKKSAGTMCPRLEPYTAYRRIIQTSTGETRHGFLADAWDLQKRDAPAKGAKSWPIGGIAEAEKEKWRANHKYVGGANFEPLSGPNMYEFAGPIRANDNVIRNKGEFPDTC